MIRSAPRLFVVPALALAVLLAPPRAAAQRPDPAGVPAIRVGETVRILPAQAAKCAYVGAKKLGDGDIIVTLPWPRTGQPIASVRSCDGGRTWAPAVSSLSEDDGATWRDGPTPICDSHLVRSNGTVIGFDFPARPNHLWTFSADGRTGRLHRVQLADGSDPALFTDQHTLVELPDGRLLASSQVIRKGEAKSCVPLHISADGGRTWRYWSTAAADASPHRQEGFTEPRLLQLPGGDLLCFVRTANPDTARRKGFAYQGLEMVRSRDQGKTWSAPVTVADQGVYPNAVVMQNGVIALAYGRPGNNVILSADGGTTWGRPLRVAESIRAPDCGFYDSILEVTPGTLLLAYATGEVPNQPTALVLGTFLHLEKEARSIP